ncbi:MAG TPA: 16S rRNA (cytidine(1402)-2'-O)-methyltransferase [Candidatus Limnocylindria bacterium]|nr:16S rRNA (cytidine(1402)-2'-O)-methyltransferase [Candidatus Limnocylindria bacterium]
MTERPPSPKPRGRLLVVGTPIGNLADLSPRAAATLRDADLIVAEDTRLAARLLSHLGIKRATRSFNAHNTAVRLPELLGRLADDQTLVLTTDAGMPGVSDPGAPLVAAARAVGAAVEVVPGPSAVTAAMALAGVDAGGFVFGGFLPARPAAVRGTRLRDLLAAAGSLGVPLVLFEAPHRVVDLLRRLAETAPQVQVAASREITKRHEETVVGSPAEVIDRLREPRGEFTLVVSGMAAPASDVTDGAALLAAGRRLRLSDRALTEILRATGMARREAYRLVQAPRSVDPDARVDDRVEEVDD